MRIGADCLATKEKGRSLESSERPFSLVVAEHGTEPASVI